MYSTTALLILHFINTCCDVAVFPKTTLTGSFAGICEAKAWSANWCSGSLVHIVGEKMLWQSWLACQWFERTLGIKYFSHHPWSQEGALSYSSQSTLVRKYLVCFPRMCYELHCIWEGSGKASNSIPYTQITHNTGQTMGDSRSTRDIIFLHDLMQPLEIIEKINRESSYKLGFPFLYQLAPVVIIIAHPVLLYWWLCFRVSILVRAMDGAEAASVSALGCGPGPAGTGLQKCLSQV